MMVRSEAINRGIIIGDKEGYQSIQKKIQAMEEQDKSVRGWSANSFTPTIGYDKFIIQEVAMKK